MTRPSHQYAQIPKHGLFCNLTGMEFGRLKVIGYLGRIGANNCWECSCVCGAACMVSGGNLNSGHTQSCGCLHKELTSNSVKTHGKAKTTEYHVWSRMKRRCLDEKNNRYPRYGGRGIIVCDRWLNSFENFLVDMGVRPSKSHSIDRINNDGNYEPSNCRWADDKTQANNTSRTIKLNISGVTKPITAWAEECNLDRSVIVARLANGDVGEDLIRPSGLRTNKITFNGITDTYLGWSKRTGIKSETISQRIRQDKWSIEKTLTKGAAQC